MFRKYQLVTFDGNDIRKSQLFKETLKENEKRCPLCRALNVQNTKNLFKRKL